MWPHRETSIVIDGYSDLVEIGRGGSSTVYSARQDGLERMVAIKVLHVDLGDARTRRRFERECAAVGALGDPPNIVAVYSTAFTRDGRGCIVMRLMRESLGAVLRRTGPLSIDQVHQVGGAAAAALQHAHARHVVHRDVKPANLLISAYDEIALGDFDIAAVGAGAASTRTHDSMSPPHAPPERLNGTTDAGPAGDIWSLGSTLFTLLEGRPPFGTADDEGGMAGLIGRALNDPVPAFGRSDVPPALRSAIVRSLEKDPADRWASAAEFATAVGASVAASTTAGACPGSVWGGGDGSPSPTGENDDEPAGWTEPTLPPPGMPGDHHSDGRRRELVSSAFVIASAIGAVVLTTVAVLR